MDQDCKNQYLRAIIEKRGYFKKSRNEKSKLLNEYCLTTGLNRDYVIRKIKNKDYLKKQAKVVRKEKYDQDFVSVLCKLWKYFGCPCGQRMEKLLEQDLAKAILDLDLNVSKETINKLLQISSSTIDLKLRSFRSEKA